jgi:hypothetical protein
MLTLGAFHLFVHLHDSQFIVWDESLHAILAQGIPESGRFIATTYNGEPDGFFPHAPLPGLRGRLTATVCLA